MKRFRIGILLWVGMLLPFCFALLAQEIVKATSIMLAVKDQTGAGIPNAQVTIVPVPSPNNVSDKLTTSSDGKLSIEVPLGSYELTVQHPGFAKVTTRVEVKTLTPQTIDIALEVRPCSPCPMVTDLLPVSFPEQSQAVSPDGRYAIIGVDSGSEPYHAVFLEDRLHKNRRRLFNYDRHIVLLWKSDSKLFAVTDYLGSDNSRCSIFSVDEGVPPTQILDVLSRQLSETTWKQLKTHLSNHHAYVEAEVWDGALSLMVKISGYGDADPTGFTEFYEVLLPGGKS